jgi:hypothetical protein
VTWGEAAVQLLSAGAGPGAAQVSLSGDRALAGLPPALEAAGPARLSDLALWAGLASAAPGPSPLRFDPATGVLAVRGDTGGAVREALTPEGFVELTLGGQRHSGDPGSASFDPALAGATASTLAGIRFDGGGQGTLVLGPQQVPGSLTVRAGGAGVVTEDVAVAGRLAIAAATIDVGSALHGGAIALTGSRGVTVDAAGSLTARQGVSGGRVEVTADVFVNSGQVHADGGAGGQVVVRAGNVLNAGRLTADGTGPGGDGGAVRVAFTGSYIDTAAAVTSAGGAAGHGGRLTVDGGATGRLFSSGSHRATGRPAAGPLTCSAGRWCWPRPRWTPRAQRAAARCGSAALPGAAAPPGRMPGR